MSQPGDLLSQAGGFLRAAPEPGWDAIAARVIAAVRATPRPGGNHNPGRTSTGDQRMADALNLAAEYAAQERHLEIAS